MEEHPQKIKQAENNAKNDELIPIGQVTTSNHKLITGIIYAIKNAHHKGYLHSGGYGGTYDRAFVQIGGEHSGHRLWIIQSQPSYYGLRNVHHNLSYLHPGGSGGIHDRAFVQATMHVPHQIWTLENIRDNFIGIRNIKHIQSYLHSGSTAGTGDRAFVQPGIDRLYQLWEFQPELFDMKMKITDFEYDGNIQDMLNQKTQPRFVSNQYFTVTPQTVGSSLSATFKASVTDSFTWGINQSVTISIGVEVNASIPGFGGVSQSVTSSGTIGSSQSWGTETTNEVSIEAKIVPSEPGQYELSGWVDVADDLELKFTAKGEVTVRGTRMTKGGSLVADQEMPDAAIYDYLRRVFGSELKILSHTGKSVTIQVTGTMKGTYGLRSYFIAKKI